MKRFQPADQMRGKVMTYRIVDVETNTVSGYCLSQPTRDVVMHYMNEGRSLRSALWCACLYRDEWMLLADSHPFARFAQYRLLCIEYPHITE